MDSSHEGIQMLLTAEQEAQQMVAAARNCKGIITQPPSK